MSDAIQVAQVQQLAVVGGWTRERVELVKRTVCPQGVTDDEFALFMEQCKRSGLDPLLKEAFCVPRRANIGTKDSPKWVTKHEFQPSEAGMLARAERFPDFRGISAAAVFEKDEIAIDAGEGVVHHKFTPGKNRGQLLGAWCKLVRAEKTPTVVWLDLAGYVQSSPLWGKIPSTMIEKCARVAALRKAYPSAFGGLYIREEMPPEEAEVVVTGSRTAQVKAELAAKVATLKEEPKKLEAENTPWQKVQFLLLQAGMNGPKAASFIKGVTSKSDRKALTEEDVQKVQDALDVLRAESEPPMPSDADAPGEVASP